MDWNLDGDQRDDSASDAQSGQPPTPPAADGQQAGAAPEIELNGAPEESAVDAGQPPSYQPDAGDPEASSEDASVLEVDVTEADDYRPGAGHDVPPPPQAPAYAPPGWQQQQQWAYTPPPAAPPPRRGMSGCLLATLIALGILVLGGIVMTIVVGTMDTSSSPMSIGGGSQVAVIHITGMIADGGEEIPLFGPSVYGARSVMEQLRQAGKDSSVKAVLLRINSPGGSAAASQAIYKEVVRLQEKQKKPVIASMGDVAASGGYYIASAAQTIIADPGTLTGSIGVIMQSMNWSGLAAKYGVKGETIVSGPYKDGMNPMRPMREDERALMQGLVNEVYNQFVADVAKGRKKLTLARVKKLADGRVYTGSQAKRVGLIDEVGNYYDAIDLAAKAGGIEGEPQLKTYGRPGGLYGLLSERSFVSGKSALDAKAYLPAPLGPGLWMVWEGNQSVTEK